jgi:tetratricopeptide (TPR) repeat protein
MTPRIRILMVIALGLLVCGRAFASDCAALEGDWTWFTGAVMTLRDDHPVLANGKQAGTWQCKDTTRGAATIHWVNGFVDSISVSGDRISGKNQKGYPVSAQRKAAGGAVIAAHPMPGGRYSMAGANVYVQRKDWNGLLAYSQAWTQARPGDPDAWYDLGTSYGIGLNQPQNALPAFQRAAQLRTQWPQVCNAQGVVLAQLKRYREAAESFVHATEQAPNRLH